MPDTRAAPAGGASSSGGQVFATPRDVPNGLLVEDAFETTKLSFGGYLSRGISIPAVIYGGTGDATFQIYSNKADLRLEGEDGADVFIVRAFAAVFPEFTAYATNRADVVLVARRDGRPAVIDAAALDGPQGGSEPHEEPTDLHPRQLRDAHVAVLVEHH